MIDIKNKEECVGCNACVQRCPKQCIQMIVDEQGFLYPKVDLNLCINCNLCEKVCPVINQREIRGPIETFAAVNPDDKVRIDSSSGGVFFELAKKIIKEGGVVFGAKFNDKWDVVHDYAETLEEVKQFQGSKYVQSFIGETFQQAENFLKKGRKVMFTGTPCQIAALGNYLHKDYRELLLKVDIVCHGVPSPLVWGEYIKRIIQPQNDVKSINNIYSSQNDKSEISSISFRDKRSGWEKYGLSIQKNGEEFLYERSDKNIYLQGFSYNFYLRPSCFNCPSKSGKSKSDITIADYWGVKEVHPEFYSQKGISLVLINTINGKNNFDSLKIKKQESDFEKAMSHNLSIKKSSVKHIKGYDLFWEKFPSQGLKAVNAAIKSVRPSLIIRTKIMIKQILIQLKICKQ